MVVPIISFFASTGYAFPNPYGFWVRTAKNSRKAVKDRAVDIVILSPAALRILEQAERIKKLQSTRE